MDEAQDGMQVETRAFLWRNGRITDLGALPGHRESSAGSINERGQVLGSSSRSGVDRGVLWDAERLVDLGNLRPVALNAVAR